MHRVPVLFLQSQTYFGADSMIQGLMARHLDRERYDVHIAVNTGPARQGIAAYQALQDIPDVSLVPVNFGPTIHSESRSAVAKNLARGTGAMLSLPRLAIYAKQHRIKIVHGTEKPRDSLVGTNLARLIGARSVLHLHVKCHDELNFRQRFGMRQADLVLGVSRWVAQTAIDAGFPAAKVDYVLNSLDSTTWNPDTDGSAVRREFGIAPDQPVALIAARIFHWKGHRELIRAMAQVKVAFPGARLLVVGEDDPRANRGVLLTADLKALANDLGLNDTVIFAGYRSDIRELLAASDVYAMPTFEEPFGVAFLEAMAMRKPVVALRSGGVPELVEDGRAGLLSEVGDEEALATNLIRLFGDGALRRQMGEFGRERVVGYFTPQRMCEDLDKVYSRLIGRRPAATLSASAATA